MHGTIPHGVSFFQQLTKQPYRLREFPASADVNDGLDDAVTVVVNETQRSALVRNSQSKLVVVN